MDRVLMNIHPGTLDKAAFLEGPRSLAELYCTIGLTEEKISVSKESERIELDMSVRRGSRVEPREAPCPARCNQDRPRTQPVKCWVCGQPGHCQRNCPSGPAGRQTGSGPEVRWPPGQAPKLFMYGYGCTFRIAVVGHGGP